MDTNTIGKITEISILKKIIQLGYSVSLPFGDKDRYDQIWDINGKLIRVQIKTSHVNKADTNPKSFSIAFKCRTTYARNGRNITNKYTKDDIDFFATIWEQQIYLVPVEECSEEKVLRFTSAQPNNPSICWAKNYELQEVLKKI